MAGGGTVDESREPKLQWSAGCDDAQGACMRMRLGFILANYAFLRV